MDYFHSSDMKLDASNQVSIQVPYLPVLYIKPSKYKSQRGLCSERLLGSSFLFQSRIEMVVFFVWITPYAHVADWTSTTSQPVGVRSRSPRGQTQGDIYQVCQQHVDVDINRLTEK